MSPVGVVMEDCEELPFSVSSNSVLDEHDAATNGHMRHRTKSQQGLIYPYLLNDKILHVSCSMMLQLVSLTSDEDTLMNPWLNVSPAENSL